MTIEVKDTQDLLHPIEESNAHPIPTVPTVQNSAHVVNCINKKQRMSKNCPSQKQDLFRIVISIYENGCYETR